MPHYWLCIKIKWTHCSETDTQERSSVHVPHHSCNAAGKFLVHDCAAVFGGTSLHENLLEGPDLTRTHYWACYWGSAKVRLPSLAASKACSFKSKLILVIAILRRVFLWWRSNDLSKPAAGFQMLVHLFGATSSPACASYALKSRWRQRDCCQCRCRFYC